jgi:hypothetical protein
VFVYLFKTALFEILATKSLYVLLDGGWLFKLSSLWFLWSVLAATIVMCFVERYSDRKLIQILIVVLGVAFVAMFPNWEDNVYMYPYFVLGYYYAKHEQRMKKIQIVKYAAFILFPIMLLFFDG